MSATASTQPAPIAAPAPARRPGGGRIAALVASGVLGLLSLGMFTAGGLALWADGHKGADGYISASTHRLGSGQYALTTDNLDVGNLPHFLAGTGTDGRIRLQVTSRKGAPVFVGIGRPAAVSRYLRHAAHDVVTDVSYSPFRMDRHVEPGGRPSPPGAQRFWAASSSGTGRQTLDWRVHSGRWSVVVMNADGKRHIDADVRAAVKVPFLPAVGWTSLGIGLLLAAAAAGLGVAGLRRR